MNTKPGRAYFRVEPSVVRAGEAATITITPLYDHVAFDPDVVYNVSLVPMENRGFSGFDEAVPVDSVQFDDDAMFVTAGFPEIDHIAPVGIQVLYLLGGQGTVINPGIINIAGPEEIIRLASDEDVIIQDSPVA